LETKIKILNLLKKKGPCSGKYIADTLKLSRQAISRHMRNLIEQGKIQKTGETRNALFQITGKPIPRQKMRKQLKLTGLEEDRIFMQFVISLNLQDKLTPGAFESTKYAFTELLNNAIEHSFSKICVVEMIIDQLNVSFRIRDYGIGLYYSIFKKLKLQNEMDALWELIKGKTTTMEKHHSGEGIFFSSKAGDVVRFRSHQIELVFDNKQPDTFVSSKRDLNGTDVMFTVSKYAKKRLEKIFNEYAPEEYDFNFQKTQISVKLFRTEYISRSEAKRLINNLQKFRKVILDFKDVKSIGQAFADEVFRIFTRNHPDIILETKNASPAIEMMLRHVVDNIK
jgi:DNA-binding Lrp family transcriptional regulator